MGVLGFLAPPVLAQAGAPLVIFGPQTATISPNGNRSDDFVDVDAYTRPNQARPPYTLVIDNPSANLPANRRVHIEVWHNLRVVATTRDFFTDGGQAIRTVRKAIDTNPINLVIVKVEGNAPVRLSYRVVAERAEVTPRLVDVDPNTLVLRHGAAGVLQARLEPVPVRPGTLTVAVSGDDVAEAPEVVPFAAGQSQVAVPVEAIGVGQANVRVRLGDSAQTARVNVTPGSARLLTLQPAQASLQQGATALFTVGIAPRRASGNHAIRLQSSDPARVAVPASVTVQPGRGSASFVVRGVAAGQAQITAELRHGNVVTQAAAQVRVLPTAPTLAALLPATTSLQRGAAGRLVVKLSAVQSVTTTVALAARTPGILALPASVAVPPGAVEAGFDVQAEEVGQTFVVATLGASSVEAAVQVTPAPVALASFEPPTSTLVVSAQGLLTLRLNAAQGNTITVQLSTEPPGVVQVPAQLIIPSGQTQASLPVTAVAVGQADVVASLGSGSVSTRRASVKVTPQPVALDALLPNPLGVQKGASANLTLRLNAAQGEPVTVALEAQRPTLVRVPESVTIPAGQIEQAVAIQALEAGTSLVTGSLGGSVRTTTVQVSLPPPIVAQLEPATQDLPKGKLGKLIVRLDRAPQADTVVSLENTNPAALQAPAQATVPAGQLSVDVPVMALQLGQTQLRATLGASSQAATVKVVGPELVAIAIQPSTLALSPGQTRPVQAVGTYSDAGTRDITQDPSTAWSSQDAAIATVGPQGQATGAAEGQTAVTALQAILPTWGNPTPSPVVGQGTITVGPATPLAMATGRSTLTVGETATVSITTPYPAGTTAYTISLSSQGTGALQAPNQLIIAPGLTSASALVRATAAGTVTLRAEGQPFAPAQLTFSIQPALASAVTITAVTPNRAAPGATVTIAGAGFATPAGNNTVAFWGNVPAIVLAGSATQLVVRVPDAAQSGPITVANALGQAQSASFTVLREQDFGIQASPAYLKVMQGSNAQAVLNLSTTGQRPYQGLAKLTALGLPTGVTARFEPATLSAYQTGRLILNADPSAPLATAALTVKAEATLDGLPWVRESRINVEVITKEGVTGVKGRFITPAGAGIAGVIVRQDTSTNQVVTDAAGNFLLTGLATGVTTLRFDATPANALYPIWPYNVTLEAGQVLTMADWVINPPPADEKFKAINNATQDQKIEDERYPGFAVVLPAGVSINGWDGVKKTRIAVERIEPDKLPVGAPPFAMKEAYQLYFGTPMGGIPSAPIPVTLPNVADKEPGEKVEIWWFDGSPMGGTGEWKMAGLGTVTPDGKSVASDPGVGLPRFCGVCGLVSISCTPPPKPPQRPPTCDREEGGNPIDLFTGQEMPTIGGPSCGGLSPIDARLTYNPVDAFNNKAGTVASFGFGWTFGYDISLLPFAGPQKRLVMPGGEFVNLVDAGNNQYRPADDPRFAGAYASDLGNGTWEMVLKGGSRWLFEPFSGITGLLRGGPPLFLTKVTDINGNVTTIQRQPAGRILSVTGSEQRNIQLSYGTHGFATELTDHTGRRMRFEYASTSDEDTGATQPRISKVTDAQGRVTEFTYNRLSSKALDSWNDQPTPPINNTGPLQGATAAPGSGGGGGNTGGDARPILSDVMPGPCWDVVAQAKGVKLVGVKYPWSEQATLNFYSASGRVTRQRAADGRETRFVYKYHGACAQRKVGTGSAKVLGVGSGGVAAYDSYPIFQYCLDRRGNLPSGLRSGWELPEDPHQRLPQFACPTEDSEENRAAGWEFVGGTLVEGRIVHADGSQRTVRFNARGMTTEVIDGLGQSTRNVYDSAQRLVASVNPLGHTWTFAYDAANNRVLEVSPLGQRTETAWNTVFNKPTSVKRYLQGAAQGNQSATEVVQQMNYDLKGNLRSSVDPTGHSSDIVYDSRGQISRIELPAAPGASVIPTINNGSATAVARSNRKLTFAYSAAGDIRRITDAVGNDTQFESDALGRTTASIDPLGYRTQSAYNALDQLTEVKDALDQTSRLQYDAAARLSAVVNQKGVAIESYGYDSLGRPASTRDALGASTNVEYDGLNRPVRITDRKGQVTTIAYDPRGDIVQIAKPGQTIDFAYDAAGRLTQVRDAASINSYQWDAADRLVQVDTTTAAGSHRLAYQYDSLDRVTQRTLTGSGIAQPEVTTYSWDLAGRILGHATQVGGQPHTTAYEYDAAGRLAARKVQAGNLEGLVTQRYGYDAAERLARIRYIRAEGTAGEQLIEQIDYGYDAAGQRTSKTALNNSGMGASETPMSASYDAANRMTAITLGIGGTSKTYTLSHDANGNLTRKQNAQDAGDTTTYTWDANDRLIGIAQPQLAASFSYDALGRRIQATITKAGQSPATVQYLYEGAQALGEIRDGRLTHRLLTGLSLDESIARIALNQAGQKDAAGSRLLLTDALNSTIALINDDASGALATGYGYAPFGESSTIGTDGTSNPVQYTGRENDGTGLYFHRARYYDPVLKRWIAEDPVGLAAGLNAYRALDNNPVDQADPDGELPIVPLAMAYGRCVAQCMARAAAGEALFGDWDCFDAGDTAKDCALDCLNPFSWGGKGLLKNEIGKNKNRKGKDFTKAQNRKAKEQNAKKNDGQMKCEDCGRDLESVASRKGEVTPKNQAQVHHDPAIKDGGGRDSSAVVLCPTCHGTRHFFQRLFENMFP